MEQTFADSLAPHRFVLWTPPPERPVRTGADQVPVCLPAVPLPIGREDAGSEITDDAIGRGIYDYLRQFPDCPHNATYAALLRDAFPHYIADLGAQIVMLDRREADPPYVRRKITLLKILALLEPDNPGLLQKLGVACYHVGLAFSQLPTCRSDLLSALEYLQRSRKLHPDDPATLSCLGQIDFLLGDYPGAARHWQKAAERLPSGPQRAGLERNRTRIRLGDVPGHPLIDDLERMGEALVLFADGDVGGVRLILERLEEEGTLPAEFPSPEFYYLLGLCRERLDDPGGSFEAFDKALEIDPGYLPAVQAKERILEGGGE